MTAKTPKFQKGDIITYNRFRSIWFLCDSDDHFYLLSSLESNLLDFPTNMGIHYVDSNYSLVSSIFREEI